MDWHLLSSQEWRKKEVMLLMKIGADVKREARIEEQRRKSKEDKLKRVRGLPRHVPAFL